MSKIFTTLADNQREAIGKACTACSDGRYEERTGRFGPWVQCSNYACQSKVMRPRGRHVTGESTTLVQEAVAEIAEQHVETHDTTIVASGTPITPKETITMPEVAPGSLEHTIIKLVEPSIKTALANVQVDAGKVLDLMRDEMNKLAAIKPQVIEVQREGKPVATVEGAHYNMARLLKLLSAGINVHAWGPAGSGKTTAALQAAKALGLKAEIDTLDRSTTRSMIQGYMTPQGTPAHQVFTRCWESGKLYIADECDNAPGHVQTLFNSALANGHASLAWGNVERPESFAFMSTGNTPFRATAAFPDRLPGSAAFMDRLYFFYWDIDRNIMRRACGVASQLDPVRKQTTCSAPAWEAYVERLITWCAANAPTIMVTPRAAITGIKALALGESVREVADGLIFRGADEGLVSKVLHANPLPEGR